VWRGRGELAGPQADAMGLLDDSMHMAEASRTCDVWKLNMACGHEGRREGPS